MVDPCGRPAAGALDAPETGIGTREHAGRDATGVVAHSDKVLGTHVDYVRARSQVAGAARCARCPATPSVVIPSLPRSFTMTGVARVSWWVLLVLSALGTLNHFLLIFVEDNTLAFGAFAGLNALATVVLWFGYRDKALWAWGGVWFQVLSLALVAIAGDPTSPATDAALQIAYGAVAGVMAVAQVGTSKWFHK
jgi:hypothetical protein